ncbi:proprotein convertase P-domain-containing protein [uncultured Nocardioides sp.]|uniref:proprotein convertase P-domain-containing protein n=1 Tax=uncultured Nocardioides sp. TaxID=198441 RepID=UPI0026378E69|nr:proprotein convertase P-domain-containing protein [uncultured Nocardioides sp.]
MYGRRIALVSGVLLALVSPLWPTAAPATAASSAVAPTPVALAAAPGSETPGNDTAATATPIQSGARIRGTIEAGDVDYFSFTAPAGATVFATVVTTSSARSQDSALSVIDTDGSTVLEVDNDNGSQAGQSSSIAGTRLATAGTYYLQVRAPLSTNIIDPYDVYLQVRSGASTAEGDDPNDSVQTAMEIDGEVRSGVRSAVPPWGQPDVDFYKLDLKPGDTVFASLDLDPERDGVAWNGRLGFGMFGDDTDTFQTVDDPGNADAIPSEAYVVTVNRSDTFYAQVDSANSAGGGLTATYALSVTVIPAPSVSCRTYAATTTGTIADAGLSLFDIPVSDAARIGRVALDVDLAHPRMADLDAFLRAPNGSAVAIFADFGEQVVAGAQSRMRTTFDDLAASPRWKTAIADTQLQSGTGNLANFAGADGQGTWTLELRDDTAGETGTLNGVELILCPEAADPPTATTIFGADFEAGDQGFTHSGTADSWARGTPATVATGAVAGLDRCASGTSCWKTNLTGSYAPSSESRLVSPPIDLTSRSGTILASWQEWFQLRSGSHYTVAVAEDGGANPADLYTWRGWTMSATQGESATVLPQISGWHRRTADLSAYAGKVVRLTYRLTTSPNSPMAGVAIDDVTVTGPAKATPPSAPPVAPGSPATPTLSAAATRAPAAKLRASCGRRRAPSRWPAPRSPSAARRWAS